MYSYFEILVFINGISWRRSRANKKKQRMDWICPYFFIGAKRSKETESMWFELWFASAEYHIQVGEMGRYCGKRGAFITSIWGHYLPAWKIIHMNYQINTQPCSFLRQGWVIKSTEDKIDSQTSFILKLSGTLSPGITTLTVKCTLFFFSISSRLNFLSPFSPQCLPFHPDLSTSNPSKNPLIF